MSRQMIDKGDIVKILPLDGSSTVGTIAKVVDTTKDGVLIYRDTGDVWIDYKNHIITVLESE